MKRILLALTLFTAFGLTLRAQQGQRWIDYVFEGVNVTRDIQYGSNIPFNSSSPQDLLLDVYQPAYDTLGVKRPVVMLMGAGSFLTPNFSSGLHEGRASFPNFTKQDNWLVEMANDLTKKGYVVIALDHRVGWNPVAQTQTERAASIMNAVFRAQQDLRAAVRWVKSKADSLNLDTTRIAAGGSNSGGYVAIHADCLDRPEELELPKFVGAGGVPFIDTTVVGNFEGATNALPHTSNFKVVISLGGAVGDTAAMEAGDATIIGVHGVEDGSTPYGTDIVLAAGQFPIIEVSGGYDLIRVANRLGNQGRVATEFANDQVTLPGYSGTGTVPGLYSFQGPGNVAGYEPYNWPGSGVRPGELDTIKSYLDTTINFITPRLLAALDLPVITMDVVQSRSQATDYSSQVYLAPNPATQGHFTASIYGQPITGLRMLDMNGREVFAQQNLSAIAVDIPTTGLPAGIYLVHITAPNGYAIKRVMVK